MMCQVLDKNYLHNNPVRYIINNYPHFIEEETESEIQYINEIM